MKSKVALWVGVFAVSLLALMIGVMIGFRAPPPLLCIKLVQKYSKTLQLLLENDIRYYG